MEVAQGQDDAERIKERFIEFQSLLSWKLLKEGKDTHRRTGSAEASLTCPEGGAHRKTSDAFLTAVLLFCILCKSSKEMHR